MSPPPTEQALSERRMRARPRMRRWAYWLDGRFRLPVVKTRVGWDGLIGLIPVAGDAAGLLLSSVLVLEAVRLRAPPRVLARMTGNLLLDFVLGLLPLVGDLADIAWRANRRNLALLEDWLDHA